MVCERDASPSVSHTCVLKLQHARSRKSGSSYEITHHALRVSLEMLQEACSSLRWKQICTTSWPYRTWVQSAKGIFVLPSTALWRDPLPSWSQPGGRSKRLAPWSIIPVIISARVSHWHSCSASVDPGWAPTSHVRHLSRLELAGGFLHQIPSSRCHLRALPRAL